MAINDKSNENNVEGLSGLLSAILTQTSVIQAADNAIDSKANNMMAAALVIVALFGSQMSDGRGHWQWLVVLSVVIMIGTVFLVLYLTRSRRYAGTVVNINAHREYFNKNNTLLLAQLVEDANHANEQNEQILGDKGRLSRFTTYVFLLGFGLGAVTLFLVQ